MAYARQVHNMLIGERTAEEIKIEAGSAYPLDEEAQSKSAAATSRPACRSRSR